MATIALTTKNDLLSVGKGPHVRVNNGPNASWNNQDYDGKAGFDTLIVDESSTKFSYFTVSVSNDAVVTLTSASGADSKTVSIVNFEKISFWDVTMYLGTADDNSLTGTSSSESIYGFDGDDTIDGGFGTDKMFGGRGNDTYIVGSQSETVSEKPGEGTDTIRTAVSYSLEDTDGTLGNGGNVENLELTGNAKINGTGNALNNVLTGNSAVNTLTGGRGNDRLDGGGAADVLIGGAGKDTYVVDETAETVKELADGGKDTVLSSVSFTLGANVENLVLTGSAAIDAKGNGGVNVITGNGKANVITGGGGGDVLTGGVGGDTFDFNSANESIGANTHDLIKDFKPLTDQIDLSAIDADVTGGGNQAFTFLDVLNSVFSGTPGELRFVTSGNNTMIEGNIDSDKVAEFQIELTGNIALAIADFIL